MTTWVAGDTITSTWLNSVENILAAATYATNRISLAANSSYDLAGNAVATSLAFNGTVAPATGKYFYVFDVRSLNSTTTGTGYAAVMGYDHVSANDGVAAYGIIGTVTGTSGAGKLTGMYSRTVYNAAFTGTTVSGNFAITSRTGAVIPANSCILSLQYDADDSADHLPAGISFSTNNAGSRIENLIVSQSNVDIGNSFMQWNQKTSGTQARFLQVYDASSLSLFQVDWFGTMNFAASGATFTTGQRITGDFWNTTPKLAMAFQSGTTNKQTILHTIPSGTSVTSGIRAINNADPTDSGYLGLGINGTTAFLDSNVYGAGTVVPLELRVSGTRYLKVLTSGDMYLGKASAAQADNTGYVFIQCIAGAPTDVPATAPTDYVAMRYDKTNNFLYFYNGGWKKSTVYA